MLNKYKTKLFNVWFKKIEIKKLFKIINKYKSKFFNVLFKKGWIKKIHKLFKF